MLLQLENAHLIELTNSREVGLNTSTNKLNAKIKGQNRNPFYESASKVQKNLNLIVCVIRPKSRTELSWEGSILSVSPTKKNVSTL